MGMGQFSAAESASPIQHRRFSASQFSDGRFSPANQRRLIQRVANSASANSATADSAPASLTLRFKKIQILFKEKLCFL
ncbi:Hypothetical protein FKW44_020333 [Caligus rogercresseyi]|uniref:Uncharacterized protein n=1 Tax=Caligus rogercresseyi TaxID=217165 RepID=A0A7T8GX49_CALRO|nr:Hypothetical protein FKW44_020333 [Caligus rogercresseyi]